MADGIHVEGLSDGTLRIVATAKGGTVRLRVTKEYARELAGRLMALSVGGSGGNWTDKLAQQFARDIVDNMRKGR